MIHASDTPPNGDFAAYVERLTRVKSVPAAREDLFMPKGGAPADTSFGASSGLPSAQAGLAPFTPGSFLTPIKWAVALWLAAQLLARYVPGAGFLFIPALALYAAWVAFNTRRNAPGAFLNPLKDLARRAAEEARKAKTAQAAKQKNKP
ncbi:MAG: hypothetical protein JWP96_1249 [Polaromonas sp.]|nr:hypothetical protein [Polaromonas sp.]